MLYLCKTDASSEVLSRAARLVSEQRLEKARRLPKANFANSLTAELLAVFALSQAGLDADSLFFDGTGRPCVRENKKYLSLSHSGSFCACAISDTPVGVDVQKPYPASRRLIERVCTERERQALVSSDDAARDFLRLWALKEAWRKANPQADTAAMLRAEFRIAPDQSVLGPDGFRYTLFEEKNGYALALCEAL